MWWRFEMRTGVRIGVSTAAAALLLAGCGGQAPTPVPTPSVERAIAPGLERFYTQQVSWKDCGDAECTKVLVPMDYANPDGATVELSVARVPATGERIGSLFVNPGGPGGSAFDYAKAADAIVSGPVRDAYDIIGVDLRGVGKSDPVECFTDAERDALLEVDGTPDTPAEEQQIIDSMVDVAKKCERNGGELIHHIGTVPAARDLDIVRAIVGDPSFNYLGLSYGTNLGATYADAFPERVGRMVLDGALPPSLDLLTITKEQAEGLEYAFNDFARDCSEQDDCPFTGTPSQVAEQLRAFIADLDAHPIQVGDRQLNEAVAGYAVLTYLYFPEFDYPSLRSALTELVESRNGKPLLELLDERQSRAPDGRYTDNSTDAFYAVTCADTTDQVTVDEAKAYAKQWQTTAPTFGTALAWGLIGCTGWPAQAERPLERATATGSRPILVVSTRHDPATPYAWGERLATELDNGHLLTWEGTGHTAYLAGSACIDEHIDAYLLQGTVPADGTDCA